jgi:hypothetical protein
MIGENTLEHFRQKSFEKVSEIERKQVLLKEKLSQRVATVPQVGDIFVFKHPKTLGIQWVVLCSDEQNPQHLWIVPADDTPMVGSTDIELPKSALCSPLTLRCDYRLSIDKKQFDMNLRVSILEERQRQRALDKLKQISEQNVRSSVLQQETDNDLDYEEWMEQVYRAREALMIQSPDPVPSGHKIVSWISKIYQRLKKIVTFPQGGWVNGGIAVSSGKARLAWASSGVMATFFMFLIIWHYSHLPEQQTIEQQINQSYQTVQAQPSKVRQAVPPWKIDDYHSFSSSSLPSTPARQAFDAGFQVGIHAINPSLTFTTDKKDWQLSELNIFFELGRWTLLLETVSLAVYEFQYEVPKTFWEEQKQIFDILQAGFNEFKAQSDTYQESIKWVIDSFEGIEPLLQGLPSENELALYDKLIGELRDMREELP